MPPQGGRPSKLTPTIRATLLAGIKQGLTYKAACRSAGISYASLAAWVRRGKKALKSGQLNKYTRLTACLSVESAILRRTQREKAQEALKSRDYRYGWKNPCSDETRQKLREKALEKVVRRVISEIGLADQR